jgi:uncharacterized protein YjbJ (UPF0337 family)
MAERTEPEEGAEGVVEGVKGKTKEAWGDLTGDAAKARDGEAPWE